MGVIFVYFIIYFTKSNDYIFNVQKQILHTIILFYMFIHTD